MADAARPAGWLPKAQYDWIFSRVPRLCVEVVMVDDARGVLLALRTIPPNVGAWHIPGGTVLFGERVVDAVRRVAARELELEVDVGEMLGYLEYPSHYENGLDSPVSLAFAVREVGGDPGGDAPPDCEWFTQLPDGLYAEHREFLHRQFGFE